MRLLAACTLIGFGACVQAQTLVGDALLCETEDPLAIVADDKLAGKSGSEIVKHVQTMIKLQALAVQFNQTMATLAQTERGVYRDTRTPDRGATSSRILDARDEQRKAEDGSRKYVEFSKRCATTSSQSQPATVIDRRPISGALKVRTEFRGHTSDLWTLDSFVR